jgi:hypothetical protein
MVLVGNGALVRLGGTGASVSPSTLGKRQNFGSLTLSFTLAAKSMIHFPGGLN